MVSIKETREKIEDLQSVMVTKEASWNQYKEDFLNAKETAEKSLQEYFQNIITLPIKVLYADRNGFKIGFVDPSENRETFFGYDISVNRFSDWAGGMRARVSSAAQNTEIKPNSRFMIHYYTLASELVEFCSSGKVNEVFSHVDKTYSIMMDAKSAIQRLEDNIKVLEHDLLVDGFTSDIENAGAIVAIANPNTGLHRISDNAFRAIYQEKGKGMAIDKINSKTISLGKYRIYKHDLLHDLIHSLVTLA